MESNTNTRFRLIALTLLCGLSVLQASSALAQGVAAGGAAAAEGAAGAAAPCPDPMIRNCRGETTVRLLQPLDDKTKNLPVSARPFEVFFRYFNMSWPWLIGVASGIAVLQAVWGGVLIMTNYDVDEGKEKIQWAVGGMVMIALAGFILRFLNPIFYA